MISGEYVTWLLQTPHEKSWRFLSKTDTCPAASCGSLMVEKRVCFVIMNSFLSSRSNFPAKKNKFWCVLDQDMKFSARKSAHSRKKESPASFCIESHVFSLLFKKAQITFRQRQWWDLSNAASFVHFGCRNPKLLRAATLNAWHLVTTTGGGGGSSQSGNSYFYPESLLVRGNKKTEP